MTPTFGESFSPRAPASAEGFPDMANAIQITNGRMFLPLEPEHPANVYDLDYIAHSLSLQCRWMGGTSNLLTGAPLHYSVAQHSVHVADLVNLHREKLLPNVDWSKERSPALYGLMHDASEAYLCDIPRPLKPAIGNYYAFEAALMKVILREFAVPVSDAIRDAVRQIDNSMIFWERDRFIGKPCVAYANEQDHPGTSISDVIPNFRVWSPEEAKERFLMKFAEIALTDGNFVPFEFRAAA